jgi:hypothetical protein
MSGDQTLMEKTSEADDFHRVIDWNYSEKYFRTICERYPAPVAPRLDSFLMVLYT